MKILLAADDDAASYEAALIVSDWFPDDASVVALHVGAVAPSTAPATPAVIGGLGYPVVALPALRAEQGRIYREAREIAARAAATTDGAARTATGDPATTIVEVAEEIGADLIVVGTGDRSWLSRLLNPSVSAGVLRDASCPVLVVRSAR
ncbi:MAG: universal stress protein [Acidimicrobiales bacterium]|nr:universal stress protein [Acidimicrobiales bacterium]